MGCLSKLSPSLVPSPVHPPLSSHWYTNPSLWKDTCPLSPSSPVPRSPTRPPTPSPSRITRTLSTSSTLISEPLPSHSLLSPIPVHPTFGLTLPSARASLADLTRPTTLPSLPLTLLMVRPWTSNTDPVALREPSIWTQPVLEATSWPREWVSEP